MEPGHEDREYLSEHFDAVIEDHLASMEPGHEDREYLGAATRWKLAGKPQWSPVMKTGNTSWMRRARPSDSRCLNGARS